MLEVLPQTYFPFKLIEKKKKKEEADETNAALRIAQAEQVKKKLVVAVINLHEL